MSVPRFTRSRPAEGSPPAGWDTTARPAHRGTGLRDGPGTGSDCLGGTAGRVAGAGGRAHGHRLGHRRRLRLTAEGELRLGALAIDVDKDDLAGPDLVEEDLLAQRV